MEPKLDPITGTESPCGCGKTDCVFIPSILATRHLFVGLERPPARALVPKVCKHHGQTVGREKMSHGRFYIACVACLNASKRRRYAARKLRRAA